MDVAGPFFWLHLLRIQMKSRKPPNTVSQTGDITKSQMPRLARLLPVALREVTLSPQALLTQFGSDSSIAREAALCETNRVM